MGAILAVLAIQIGFSLFFLNLFLTTQPEGWIKAIVCLVFAIAYLVFAFQIMVLFWRTISGG